MFQLGVITDEVSQNIETAAEFAEKYGLSVLEIRSVNNKGPFEQTSEDASYIRKVADNHNLKIAAISAPLFKCHIGNEDEIREHISGFRRCAENCRILGCSLIRGFDFWEEGADLSERIQKYQPIIEICREFGVRCVIEYDPSVHSCNAQKLSKLVNAIDSEYIGALYDPGNGLWVDPEDKVFPDDYEILKDRIRHIHIKDCIYIDGKPTAVKVGTGLVDYHGLFSRLKKDDYSGCIMLETHYRKEVHLTEEQLKRPGGNTFSEGAYEASAESMESLKSIIKESWEF